ncbi:uncharacterized protein LOC135940655 [Cloeon dipterum]|uniref:uncharacterized protein LOC135940655 n=1 Tax=Cloeon dipterum TaxID=197152 RepID=UPI00321FD8BD
MAQKEAGGRNCWAITAGILSTIQGGCYLALALAALALYYCKIETSASTDNPAFLLYFIYFYNPQCNDTLDSVVEGQPIKWPPKEFPTATLTWQWAIAYCAINGVWIFTSLFLTIAGAVSSKRGIFRIALPVLWLISTLAVLVADVVASILYGLDLGKVLESETSPLSALLDVSSLDPPIQLFLGNLKNPEASLPSAALLIAVARGGILWVLNLILFLGVLVSTIKSNKAAKKQVNNQRPPVQAAAATSGRHGDSSWHQSQGGVANPAYDKHGDHDLHAVSKKQTRPRDAEILAAEMQPHSHQELRNQRPWSYLDPAPEELEQVRRRPRTPPAEEWSFSPDSTLKLPRATLGHPQPSAPYPTEHQHQNQFYHYPFPEQQYGNRYLNTAGRHNPYLK